MKSKLLDPTHITVDFRQVTMLGMELVDKLAHDSGPAILDSFIDKSSKNVVKERTWRKVTQFWFLSE